MLRILVNRISIRTLHRGLIIRAARLPHADQSVWLNFAARLVRCVLVIEPPLVVELVLQALCCHLGALPA